MATNIVIIALRPDQSEAVENLRAALRQHQSALLCAPCGFGKTVVAAYMAEQAQSRDRRVIFAVHRRELARQTALTFEQFGIRFGWIMAGKPMDPFASVQIASADTLRRRPELAECDLFVPDEAHLWTGKTRVELINVARASGAKIVPLTATPQRGNGKGLSEIADAIVPGPSVRDLIARGSLAQYRAYAPVVPDLSGIHTKQGDYVVKELEERFSKPAIYGDAISAYRKYAPGKRMIGYCYSRDHGRDMSEAFRNAGIPAAFMDGETPDRIRQEMIAQFADGRILVLFNVALFREGFDLSAQVGRDVPIQAVGLYNPTKSLPLAVQMMMRPMRPQPEPAILLDHAGIFSEHGLPDDDREWPLDGRVSKRGPQEQTIATVICPSCAGTFRPAPKCPYCGAVRVVAGREVDEVEAEMAEVDVLELRKHREFVSRKIEERECKTLEDWQRLAARRGHKPGWAWHRYNSRNKKRA